MRYKHAGNKPFYGLATLYLSCLAVCFAPLIEGGTTHLPVFILELIVLSIVLVQVAGWLDGGAPVIVAPRLDYPLVLLFIAALVSFVVAPYKYMALTWIRLIVYYSLFYLLARTALHGRDSLLGPVAVLMLMGAVEIVAAGRQYLLGLERVNGTFFNPNMLAGYIAVPAVFALSLLVIRGIRIKGLTAKTALACLFLASLATILLSGSRGGLVSFVIGSFVVLWHRSRLFSIVFAVLIAAGVFIVPNPVRERIYSTEPFAYSRAEIWSSAAQMAADHPFGVGLGNFKYVSGRYAFPVEEAVIKYGKKPLTAHNEYLHFTAEMGVAGLLAVVLGVYSLLSALALSARDPVRDMERPVAVGALGGVCAVLAHSLVDSNMHEPGIVFMFIFTACIGMEAGALHRVRLWSMDVPKAKAKRLAAFVYVLVFLLAAWSVKHIVAKYYFDKAADAMKAFGPEAAIVPSERALFLEPGQAKYHEQMASVYYALYGRTGNESRLLDALDELAVAEGLNPNYPVFPSLTASLKVAAAGESDDVATKRYLYESAADDLDRALKSAPYDAELMFREAELYAWLGEAGKAEKLLTRLREVEPNFLRARYSLALLYSRTGREELSRRECYSIIGLKEELSGRPLGGPEARFVSVDIEKVYSLLKELGGKG